MAQQTPYNYASSAAQEGYQYAPQVRYAWDMTLTHMISLTSQKSVLRTRVIISGLCRNGSRLACGKNPSASESAYGLMALKYSHLPSERRTIAIWSQQTSIDTDRPPSSFDWYCSHIHRLKELQHINNLNTNSLNNMPHLNSLDIRIPHSREDIIIQMKSEPCSSRVSQMMLEIGSLRIWCAFFLDMR